MSRLTNILFVINPISGVGKKNTIADLIADLLPKNKFNCKIKYTEKRKHGYEIASEEHKNFDAIIAVGGDGSVNEIGSALIGTNCALGIVPCGSGNGLARHLNIPLKPKQAIERIEAFSPQRIDTGTVNAVPFLGTCGFGFDGYIANKFDKFGKRGFLSYIKLVTAKYTNYASSTFTIQSKNFQLKKEAFLCSVANSSEFGNGFTVAPQADIQDAKFELVLMERFPLFKAPFIIKKFFTRTIEKCMHYEAHSFSNAFTISVNGPHPSYFHIDGEPLEGATEFKIEINPASLKVL